MNITATTFVIRFLIVTGLITTVIVLMFKQGRRIDLLMRKIDQIMEKMNGLVIALKDSLETSTKAEMAEATLESIVQLSDTPIISKNMDGRILAWNCAAERVFGYTFDEIYGKPISIIIPPELHGEEIILLSRLANGEKIDRFKTIRVTKDGRHIHVELMINPIRNKTGIIIGATKVVHVL